MPVLFKTSKSREHPYKSHEMISRVPIGTVAGRIDPAYTLKILTEFKQTQKNICWREL